MKVLDPRRLALEAVAATEARPATAIVHDVPDARMVVFRIAPGQEVPPHTTSSTVTLAVLAGRGVLSGGDGEREGEPGEVAVYEPNEMHGMRAGAEDFLLLATITPRPGAKGSATLERAGAERQGGAA